MHPRVSDPRQSAAAVQPRAGRRDSRSAPYLARLAPDGALHLGATEDPYGPAERRSGRTRAILEAFRALEGLHLDVTTRSTLVTRDLDLLAEISRSNRVRIRVAIPTLDRRLAQALEPEAPRPDLRLKTISSLAAARVPVGLLVEPLLPRINDNPGALDRLAEAAAGAGATRLEFAAIFPTPSGLATLFPRLEPAYPDLVERYRGEYERSACLPEDRRAGVADLAERLGRKHGLATVRGGRESGPRARDRRQLPLL